MEFCAFYYFSEIIKRLKENHGKNHLTYEAYHTYCVSLDRYLYFLMYLDNDEQLLNVYDFIGFNPGHLFSVTVDSHNEELYYYLSIMVK